MKVLSIVVPILNESRNLMPLYFRLRNVLDQINQDYEIIFVNDGSKDDSLIILENIQKQLPDRVVIIDFLGNFGQHAAVVAGFKRAKGKWIITLDADLQNPPEEIKKLWYFAQQGYDLVSGIRLHNRKDNWVRCKVSVLANFIRLKLTNTKMIDHGSMFRCYRDYIAKLIADSRDCALFIPSLAHMYAKNPIEVTIQHESRYSGKSRYNLSNLIKLNFDLILSNSLSLVQFFTIFGITVVIISVVSLFYLIIQSLVFGKINKICILVILFLFLIGIILIGIGILGEYLGRIYRNVSSRPYYVVNKLIDEVEE